jgi:LacI family transcriptional regulator, galactose operon repressor
MKKTINDIAKQLGVSNTLVSFVLNGKNKEKRISDEMTSKVLELAKSMNYTPNYLAKSLRHGKTNTLGLFVGDIANAYFGKLARHIEIEASKFGYKVIFSNSDEDLSKFKSQLEVLKNGQVDGFILVPPAGSEKELLKLKHEKIPFVVVDRIFENVFSHSVTIDNYQASYDATEYLIKNNRKNFALINNINELANMKRRGEGFYDALKNNGIAVNKSLIKHLNYSHDPNYIMEATRDIVKNGADAILFTNSQLGVLGLECLKELRVNISNSMSIISFDDSIAYELFSPTISAIRQPIEQMSKEALRILIDIIENKYIDGKYENIVLDSEIIIRESC